MLPVKRKRLIALTAAALCSLIVVIVSLAGLFEKLELSAFDLRFRWFAEPEKASRDVVIVAIDDKSLKEFKRNNIVWKWPRDYYAALVRYLHRGGAKIIIFDILFSDSDIDRLNTDAEQTDGAFAKAIKDAGNVILAAHLQDDENLLGGDNPYRFKNKFSFTPIETKYKFPNFKSAVLPIPIFQQSACALGAANYQEDYTDGICRHASLFYVFQGDVIPQIGMAAYLTAKKENNIAVNENVGYEIEKNKIPVDKDGNFIIKWYGKGGPDGCFKYYSVVELISSARDEELNKKPLLASSEFKDKIVIVGANAPGLFDYRNTPFTAIEPYPAMEIYATILSNLLQQDYIREIESYFTIISILFFSLIVSFSVIYFPRIWVSILITAACLIFCSWTAVFLFQRYNLWLEIVPPLVSILFTFSISAVISYQTEGKARRELRKTFGRYLSPVVISEVLEKREEIGLGGKEILGTVLFSDIKDFTSISEKIPPQEIVALLNEYFTYASEIILKHEGLLDKYVGDAMMAIFGAPLMSQSHASQACQAALEILSILKNSWNKPEENRPAFETRIGINTGTMVVGNIGSNRRLDYTAIGDNVNLASRLESVNKIFGTDVIISESTFILIKDEFLVRELDILRVKGKQLPVKVFELIAKSSDVDKSLLSRLHNFKEGLELFRERKFDLALKVFTSIHDEDRPAKVYLQRCREYMLNPPPQDWDCVFNLEIK